MRETPLLEQMAGAPPTGDGRVAAVESSTSAGFMPPLHAHASDEVVHVVEGRITVFVGAESVRLVAGETFSVPSGAAHTFRVEGSRARAVFTTFTASAGRYADFLRAAGPVVGDAEWSSPEDAATVAALAAAAGVELLGPPGMLPAKSRIAARAA